jgi:hypothetical protein
MSNKSIAQKIAKWIDTEVLPALLKHGTYTMPKNKLGIKESIESTDSDECEDSIELVKYSPKLYEYSEESYESRKRELEYKMSEEYKLELQRQLEYKSEYKLELQRQIRLKELDAKKAIALKNNDVKLQREKNIQIAMEKNLI